MDGLVHAPHPAFAEQANDLVLANRRTHAGPLIAPLDVPREYTGGVGTKWGAEIDIERLPVATVITRDNVLVAANAAHEQVTGYAPAEILGRTVLELIATLIDPRDRAMLERLAGDPRAQGSLWCRVLRKDGQTRPVRVE